MTFTRSAFSQPKSVNLTSTNGKTNHLIIHGQGVYLFGVQENATTASFVIYDENRQNGLHIELTDESVKVDKLPSFDPLIDEKNTRGLTTKRGAYYWFSIDSQNQLLQAGIGEARIENVIYRYAFPIKDTDPDERKKNKNFLESLVVIDELSISVTPLQLLRDPITSKVPLLIKNTEHLTMENIAHAAYLPKAHLSFNAQQLYECIAGKQFVLDSPDFPDFSKAIEYSIATPGLWCHERIKEKSTEFDKDHPDILETYLRITLNENNGESPGIPYVMEIWPVGHFSPVHNHGGSSAVIRVLHGKINVKLFPFLCDEKDGVDPFSEAQFVKDDITWISPTLNQVHQLQNLETNSETCITIQCYIYEQTDKTHYDYFDYLDGSGKKNQYEPDSDMDFILFKETIKSEWENRPHSVAFDNCAGFSIGKIW
jgi:hypothetical protein